MLSRKLLVQAGLKSGGHHHHSARRRLAVTAQTSARIGSGINTHDNRFNSSSHVITRRGVPSRTFASAVELDQSSNNLANSTSTSTTVSKEDLSKPKQQKQQPSNGGGGRLPIPDFNDAKAAYESKTNGQLAKAVMAFGLCQVRPLVRHSENLLKTTRNVAGDRITDGILKQTLFGHFCAGESEQGIKPTIAELERVGIGSILDFAAEDDGEHTAQPATGIDRSGTSKDEACEIVERNYPKVRMYDYESEAACDKHVETFKKCINSVANLQKDGFAAIKVTALGNPKLLSRMSRAIVEAQNLFAKFDQDGDGLIGMEEFQRGLDLFFIDNKDTQEFKQRVQELMPTDSSGTGYDTDRKVDYITWSMLLAPADLPKITAGCREVGPLALAAPTEEEVELIEKMYERGHALAQEAARCGVRLLVDAEQVRFQPAIDNLVLDLQRTYNACSSAEFPIIYNTYQCYLKDAGERLRADVVRSERYDYHFGAKLVRGAYMESERALADSMGLPSPIHDTIQDTHDCYNDSVKFLLEHSVKSEQGVEVMCATHNQETIELAIQAMNELGIDPKANTISFAQLFGMMDNLTFNLGKHGYRAYKYVPYGEVKMVMPYLIRLANENSAIAGGAAKELRMISGELKRRMFGKSAK